MCVEVEDTLEREKKIGFYILKEIHINGTF